uniref:DNA-directed RNA polymerase III subunit RPC3 n=1 Tax=Cacopsylla melanoneura TaxID=428564 RepID=A0A8D9FHG1_9HEMI
MGSQCGDLILIILDRHFGPNVKTVARKLLYGPKPLKLIFLDIDLKLVQVKEALHILIKHDLVLFAASKNGLTAEYKLNYKHILKILSYSKYLQLIETKYTTVAKDIVYDFMINGYSDLSRLIVRLGKQSTNEFSESVNLSPIKDTVTKLVLAGYVIRHCDIASLNEENHVPKLSVEDADKSLIPNIDMKVLYDSLEHKDESLIVDQVLFKLNLARFDQDYRNEIILNGIESRFSSEARLVLNELVLLADDDSDQNYAESNAISSALVKDKLKKKHKQECNVDQWLKIMEDVTCGWIRPSSDVSNAVVIRFSHIIETLANNLIENIIHSKYGMKAARIYRIIRTKKHVEQNQIQRLAMIPDKEAKTLTYNLLQDNFVMIQELRKPGATQGPSKSFFLFHVNLRLVLEVGLKYCVKGICNAFSRIDHEIVQHQSLVDKFSHIENLRKSVNPEQEGSEEILEALDQLMCPSEKEQVTSVNKMNQLLENSILNANESMFLLDLYKHHLNLDIK